MDWKEINLIKANNYCWESDGVFDYVEIHPNSLGEEAKEQLGRLMQNHGVVGSIWVEYYIKEGK